MSYPKKAKGWRSITVDDRQFRWKFHSGTLTLQGDIPTGQQAIIVLKGWTDPWLSFQESSEQAQPSEPQIVTPQFVGEAIKFSISVGWKPEIAISPLRIDFENGTFKLRSDETNSEPTTTASARMG